MAGVPPGRGVLQLSRRVGTIGLSGQLGYSLKPQAKLETIVLSGDRRLGEAYLLNLGVARSVGGKETLLTAGLNKSLGSYGLGLSTSYSSRGVFAVGLQLFIAMGWDPYWAPQRKGVRLVPRPGHVAEFDFPVILTSAIDGTVYLVEKTARRGIGDVAIELLDLDRKVLSTIKSSSDGYYIVPAVVQGRYYFRVAPEQLKQFDLIDPGERDISILPDGKFINGVDFLPSRKPAGKVSDPPRTSPMTSNELPSLLPHALPQNLVYRSFTH